MKATQIILKKSFLCFFFSFKCFHNFFDFILFFEKMKTGFFCSMPTTRSFFLFSSLSLALTVTQKRGNSFANKLIINASVKTFSFFLSILKKKKNKKLLTKSHYEINSLRFLSFVSVGVVHL